MLEYLLVDREYPDLRMNELFSVIKVQGAFRPDSLESAHPMTYNGQMQRSIVYDKGNSHYLPHCLVDHLMLTIFSFRKAASVIRMFQYALGEELFASAMQYYLEEL